MTDGSNEAGPYSTNSFGINCIFFNARSLPGKLFELHELLSTCLYDVILICETWLTDKTTESVILNQSEYFLFREDRRHKLGGGLCALIRNNLKADKLEMDRKFDCMEILVFDLLNLDNKFRFILGYRPPGNTSSTVSKLFKSELDELGKLCAIDASVVVVGDFNFPGIDWSDGVPISDLFSNSCKDVFINFIKQNALCQFVMEPTRYGKNILDLVLCNDRLAIFDLKVTQPFSTSDHDSIIFKLRSSSDSHNHIQNGRMKYNFKLADWDNLAADLSQVDWENLFNCSID